jgi:uncharacterized membrane protein YphA (DoxX/SURF4 family)
MPHLPLPSVTTAWIAAGIVFLAGALVCGIRSCCGPRIVMPRGQVQVSLLAAYFLVCLRLAIGWHFFFEGYQKVASVYRGPTETSRPWTSAGYLRESVGPLAPFFRSLAGDPDEELLALLHVADPQTDPPAARLSQPLNDRWEVYFEQFVSHYNLSGDQRTKARDLFENHKNALGRWLVEGTRSVGRSFPSGSVNLVLTTPQRVAEYRSKLQELRDLLQRELPAFESDVAGPRLNALKAEIRGYRNELWNDLEQAFSRMRADLENVLTVEQKAAVPPPVPVAKDWKLAAVDWLTRWGLLATGLCLLLGLATRPAAVLAAALLLLIYLAMPPLPGTPANPRAEGNYLFIDKNLIEVVALLLIASTRSGEWFGLDGLLRFVPPFRCTRSTASGGPQEADCEPQSGK